jgi:hypothetical protein
MSDTLSFLSGPCYAGMVRPMCPARIGHIPDIDPRTLPGARRLTINRRMHQPALAEPAALLERIHGALLPAGGDAPAEHSSAATPTAASLR